MRTARFTVLWIALFLSGKVMAEIPPPTDAQVLAAIEAEINEWKVCARILSDLPIPLSTTTLPTLSQEYFDKPEIAQNANAFVKAGLVIHETSKDSASGKPVHVLKLTKLGEQVWKGRGIATEGGALGQMTGECYGVRKVTKIVAYTPLAQVGSYWVIHVSYRWAVSDVADWAIKLGEIDPSRYSYLQRDALQEKRIDQATLVYSNVGWIGQSTFGYPIKEDASR